MRPPGSPGTEPRGACVRVPAVAPVLVCPPLLLPGQRAVGTGMILPLGRRAPRRAGPPSTRVSIRGWGWALTAHRPCSDKPGMHVRHIGGLQELITRNVAARRNSLAEAGLRAVKHGGSGVTAAGGPEAALETEPWPEALWLPWAGQAVLTLRLGTAPEPATTAGAGLRHAVSSGLPGPLP